MVWWWMTIFLRILKRVERGRFNCFNTNPYLVTYNWKGRLTVPLFLLRIDASDTSGQNGQTLAGYLFDRVDLHTCNYTFVCLLPIPFKMVLQFSKEYVVEWQVKTKLEPLFIFTNESIANKQARENVKQENLLLLKKLSLLTA